MARPVPTPRRPQTPAPPSSNLSRDASRPGEGRVTGVHRAQLLSYLKLGGYRLGYLLNFNVKMLKDGICRLANGL